LKKLFAALSLLAVVTALILVQPARIVAQPSRSDLEERVATLEAEGSISRGHIQTLESHVRDLEASAEASLKDQKGSDLEASLYWVRHDYIPLALSEYDELAKRVKHLEREQLIEHVCAEPTAKQRAEVVGRIGAENQAALARSDKKLCLDLRATPE
jgi:hypothetical protein